MVTVGLRLNALGFMPFCGHTMNTRKTHTLRVRITEGERVLIAGLARDRSLSISELVRFWVAEETRRWAARLEWSHRDPQEK